MKILNCSTCHDLLKVLNGWRHCACGKSAARGLKDGISVQVWGSARLLSLEGGSYSDLARTASDARLSVVHDRMPRVQRVKTVQED